MKFGCRKVNRATGVTRGGEELWLGDRIKCKVFLSEPYGVFLHVEGTVEWHNLNGMYILNAKYQTNEGSFQSLFPLWKVVNEPFEFVKKTVRVGGDIEEIVWSIIGLCRSYFQEPPNAGDYSDSKVTGVEDTKIDIDVLQTILNASTHSMMDRLTSNIGMMINLDSKELAKFMEETR